MLLSSRKQDDVIRPAAANAQSAPAYRRGYRIKEIAEILGYHYETVRVMIKAGRLKAHRLSARRIIILEADLEQFLADREVKAAA